MVIKVEILNNDDEISQQYDKIEITNIINTLQNDLIIGKVLK